MDKQIEELQQIINSIHASFPDSLSEADAIYHAGYRKVQPIEGSIECKIVSELERWLKEPSFILINETYKETAQKLFNKIKPFLSIIPKQKELTLLLLPECSSCDLVTRKEYCDILSCRHHKFLSERKSQLAHTKKELGYKE